jgi:adenylosuccinate synthase
MNKIQIVVGGQFGSEGKGAVARWLADGQNTACCRIGGPNAGHTAYGPDGRKWQLQQVPIGAIANNQPLFIGAGSEVDPLILEREIAELDQAGYEVSNRLFVDRSATVLLQSHAVEEHLGMAHGEAGLTRRIGSTGKGVGAARADRIWRRAGLVRDLAGASQLSVATTNTAREMIGLLEKGKSLLIEGTQGYGLGLHTEYYPYATSGDCRAIDFLAQAGISPWVLSPTVAFSLDMEVWIVFRTFPIRVAGNSGPLHGETTWEELGLQPEFTTVTKKKRRVGAWDSGLAREALRANGGGRHTRVVITMLDHLFPSLINSVDIDLISDTAGTWLTRIEDEIDHPISVVGTGPTALVDLEDYC